MKLILLVCMLMLTSHLVWSAGLKPKVLSDNPVAQSVSTASGTPTSSKAAEFTTYGKLKSLLLKNFTRKLTKRLAADEQDDISLANKLGTWALITGIAGFVFMFIPYLGIASLALLPAAIILGAIGLSRANKTSDPRKAGMVKSLIGLILGSAGVLLFLIALAYLAAWDW